METSSEGKPGRAWRLLFGVAIFVSAFLLFQVQLILGKFLLPWFGGTSSVWTTCLLFFQSLLFGGYLYAHKISTSFSFDGQTKVHFLFLAVAGVSVLLLWHFWGSPFLPSAEWKPIPGSAPIFGILKLLFLGVGLPFLLLSSTGPLLQKWYDHLHRSERAEPPYFLYALSNAGSLLGLVSYPVIFEPKVGLLSQSLMWGVGFVIFVLSCAICAWRVHRSSRVFGRSSLVTEEPSTEGRNRAARPKWRLWFALAALGSVMLLATTNWLTQDVAPIPLLWVLPLSVYLLSFVFTFQRRNWYFRGAFHFLFAITAFLAVFALFRGANVNVFQQIGVFLMMLFAACMVCHGELARIKPEARFLTAFYLTLSAGGAFGGIFVGIIAPLIFPAIWEYHIGLWAIAALLVFILFRDKASWLHQARTYPLLTLAIFAALYLLPEYLREVGGITIPGQITRGYDIGIVALLVISMWLAVKRDSKVARRHLLRSYEIAIAIIFLLWSGALYINLTSERGRLLHRERNFYGAISVQQYLVNDALGPYVELMHGRITHGNQLEQHRSLPTSYFNEKSGAGLALTTGQGRAKGGMRVGVIGLGVGTIAAYSRANDVYRFYELNPAVIRLAQRASGYFTFLDDSPAKIEIVPGDARLSLEAEAARGNFQNFDVLFVDAFNGDSVPVHLLTAEAMKLYLSHLRGPDSVIVVQILNRAVDLAPVVAGLAKLYGLNGTLISTDINRGAIYFSEWILLTRGNSLNIPEIQRAGRPILAFTHSQPPVWTDDYSDLFSALDLDSVSLKFKSLVRF